MRTTAFLTLGFLVVALTNAKLDGFKESPKLKDVVRIRNAHDMLIHGGAVQLTAAKAKVEITVSDSKLRADATKASPLKIVGLFGLWYLFTIASSSAMTSASKAMPLPLSGTAMRLWVGAAFITLLWKLKLKPEPVVTKATLRSVAPVSAMSTLTLLLTSMAYAAGSLSFVAIVKSAEPATMALINAFAGKLLPLPVYASLLPVIGGVALASKPAQGSTFSMACLVLSMMVNVTSSLRSLMAKTLTNTGLKPSALTGLNSILGSLMITPIALVVEFGKLTKLANDVAVNPAVANQLKRFLVLNCISGICLYLFYEGSFMCLNAVGPLSHSIGSTIGRVVVIVAGVLIYKTKMSPTNVFGAALSVGGVFFYSWAQEFFAKRAALQKSKKA